jgi:hypothetical protein
MALTLHGTVSDNTVALDRKTATPLIINGDMQIAQRGTSLTGYTGGAGYTTLDRWRLDVNTLGTWTVAQTASAPDDTGLINSYRIDCTTADASPASGDFCIFTTRLEGQNIQTFKKGTSYAEKMTISFWVKSNKTGTYIMEIDDNDNARNINQAYTISSANTWEKKVLSFVGDTTGAFGNDNGDSLRLLWWLGSGSDFSSGSLQTAWAGTDNTKRAVGNVNLGDSTDNDWSITGVQLEVGEFDSNSIPDFQFEDRATSLARCQRYYFKTFAQGTTPAQNVDTDNVVLSFAIGGGSASYGSYQFPVTMRTSGTLYTFNPYATNASLRKPNSTTDIATDTVTTNEANMYIGVLNVTTSLHLHFVVDAEL